MTSSTLRSLDMTRLDRWMARQSALGAPWLHEEVARRMDERLEWINLPVQQVLVWGPCLGGGPEPLRRRYPQAACQLAEPSPLVIAASQGHHKSPWWKRLWPGSAAPAVCRPDQLPSGHFDLVFANMSLHACADPQAELARWAQLLKKDGYVMWSGLGPDTLRALEGLFRDAGWGACAAPQVDMHDLGDMALHAGLTEPVMDMEMLTLTWATAEEALDEIRTWGGNAHPGRFAGCRTPRWRARLEQLMRERLADQDGRIRLQVELVYGHAIKPAKSKGSPTEQRIDLADLKSQLKDRR